MLIFQVLIHPPDVLMEATVMFPVEISLPDVLMEATEAFPVEEKGNDLRPTRNLARPRP